MIIEQQRDLGRQCLRICGENRSEEEKSDFREQMLLHNSVEGILPFEVVREDGERVYEYSIYGLESLRGICTHKKLAKKDLTFFLTGILQTVYHGREFLLSEDDYVVNPDTIFSDNKSGVQIAYYSGYCHLLREQLRELAEFLMDNAEYRDESAVMLVYTFYMLTKNESCSLENLFALLKDDENKMVSTEKVTTLTPYENTEQEIAASEFVEQAAFREIKPDVPSVSCSPGLILRSSPMRLRLLSVLIPAVIIATELLLFRSGALTNTRTGENGVLPSFFSVAAGFMIFIISERKLWQSFAAKVRESLESAAGRAEEATVVFCGDGTAVYPFSLVSEEYPAINISRFPAIVGKDAGNPQVNYVLDVIGVSRIHLRIDKDGDEFTVCDMNSSNGTYLNGKKLIPYKPEKCRRGDEICLGSRNCRFFCN